MESSWHSYPKIWNLGHAAIGSLLEDPVIVEEKIDGSQFSFGRFGDQVKLRSKGVEILEGNEGMFFEACEWVRAQAPKLQDGWTYRAEYLMKPKHNVLAYDRVPKNGLIVFDVNPSQESYLSYEEKRIEAERIGLECVPLLHEGRVEAALTLTGLLQRISVLGGQNIEGFVIKNYAKFGPDKKALMGKHVSESFKETHKVDWKIQNPAQSDIVLKLINIYRTPARWEKAVIHLREKGQIEDSPRDIGFLIKEVASDIMAECEEEIKAELMKWAFSKISRGVTGGLPEWYKQKLLEKQFEAAGAGEAG